MPLDYLRGSAGLAGKERSETREVAVSEALDWSIFFGMLALQRLRG
jgi:hypothetical protein